MDGWTDVLNTILAVATLASALWALRQRAVLRRLESGLTALFQGRYTARTTRSPEDREPVLKAFDRLAEDLQSRHESAIDTPSPTQMGPLLERLCTALRSPLVAIQSYATLLRQQQAERSTALQGEYLNKLLGQVNGLLRLLEAPTNLSELRHELSGLQRQIHPPESSLISTTVLLVDEENPSTTAMIDHLGNAGWTALVAPGADAALVMARAVAPRAILINGAHPDGLGWKVLGQLKGHEETRGICAWLYSFDTQASTGVLWTPLTIQLWPPGNSEHPLALEGCDPGESRVSVVGDPDVGHQISQALLEQGHILQPTAGQSLPVLEGCCTLVIQTAGQPVPLFALVVPCTMIQEDPAGLAHRFRTSTGNDMAAIAAVYEQLCRGLASMA